MFEIARTNNFKRDLQYYQNNQRVIDRLEEIFSYMLHGKVFPASWKDHSLKGKFLGYRECHISPDVLLLYKINEKEKIITLSYLGSHSELFN